LSWFAVDDRFHSHQKVALLRRNPNAATAIALWTLAGSWAAGDARASLTGRVPVHVLEDWRLPGTLDAIAALVDVGLWACDGAAVIFHDWEHWNGPDAKAHRVTEQTRVRVQRTRLRKCERGEHSKDCPTFDLDGHPWVCPRRAKKDRVTPRSATPGRDGTGRDGSGLTTSVKEDLSKQNGEAT